MLNNYLVLVLSSIGNQNTVMPVMIQRTDNLECTKLQFLYDTKKEISVCTAKTQGVELKVASFKFLCLIVSEAFY